MTYRANVPDASDLVGALTKNAAKTRADEAASLGEPFAGQTGAVGSIDDVTSGIVTISALTGMTAASVGQFITITGAATGANNGTFLITEYVSATSVKYANASGAAPDANNGSIGWTERAGYTLEDDINFQRTDRALIKGVAYDAELPTFTRPTDTATPVSASLSNLAGKTTDAKALCTTRMFRGQAVADTNTFVTMSDTGNLKHATSTDRTGVPINDGDDAGADDATFVEIVDPATGNPLEVLAGGDEGKRIFGRTRAGSATSPDAVEVEFRAVALGANLSTSVAYTWESGQPTTVDLFYGFRQRLDQLTDAALRVTMTNGLATDADLRQDLEDVRDVISGSLADEATSLAGLLTNTGTQFVFSDLPDGTPSVVEALNTLNEQIGDRDYTGSVLTDGQTVAASLQALSDAIVGAAITRVIERLASAVTAGTSYLLPASLTYVLDGGGNGAGLMVFQNGRLLDPGTVAGGNDYDETDTTHVTPHYTWASGDHINYVALP